MQLRARLLLTALAAASVAIGDLGDSAAGLGGYAVDAVHFHIFGDPLEQEGMIYARDTVALLAARDYDALEARARAAREEKQRFADGTWKLPRFYSALTLAERAPDPAWGARLAQVQKWVEDCPSSIAAPIALAEVYTAYASKAKAADPGSDAIDERLESALRVLENARELGGQDPHFWRVAHAIAVGLRWPAENVHAIYAEAMALEPAYWSNVLTHVPALLAREGVEPALIEEFASAAAATAEAGDEIYARMAWEATEATGSFLEVTPFEWERVQAGYRSLLKRYPASPGLLSQYCVLACRARDKSTARKCFAKLGGKADLCAFKSQREYSRQFRWSNLN